MLQHQLLGSLGSGELIRRDWLAVHYAPCWHYDILQALLVLSPMRLTGDPRCRDALAVLQHRRRPDGRWQPGGYWWKPPGTLRGPGRGRGLGPVRSQRDDHAQRVANTHDRTGISDSLQPDILSIIDVRAENRCPFWSNDDRNTSTSSRDLDHRRADRARRTTRSTSRC